MLQSRSIFEFAHWEVAMGCLTLFNKANGLPAKMRVNHESPTMRTYSFDTNGDSFLVESDEDSGNDDVDYIFVVNTPDYSSDEMYLQLPELWKRVISLVFASEQVLAVTLDEDTMTMKAREFVDGFDKYLAEAIKDTVAALVVIEFENITEKKDTD